MTTFAQDGTFFAIAACMHALAHDMTASSVPFTDTLRLRLEEFFARVAEAPGSDFHFEIGAKAVRRLGYPDHLLQHVPHAALESFTGVGLHLDLPTIRKGDQVVDLGSGSGTDSFCVARLVGPAGRVVGFDMNAALRWKSMAAASTQALPQLEFRAADVLDLPLARASQDVVLANGLLHLVPDQAAAIAEMARVLRPGGQLAISDLVCSQRIPDRVAGNVECWVRRVGGLMSHASYYQTLLSAAFDLRCVRPNPHFQFSCDASNLSSNTYGISSVSVLAIKREC